MEMDIAKLWEKFAALDLRYITVSARILDVEGHLGRVDKINEKISVWIDERRTQWVGFLIVAETQEDIDPKFTKIGRNLHIIHAATLAEAVERIYEDHGPRRALREHTIKDFRYIKLIGLRREETPADRFYQKLSLLLPLTRQDQNQSVMFFPDPSYAPLSQITNWDMPEWGDDPICKIISLEELLISSEQYGDIAPRIVVLGQAGSGKSDFLRYIAWLAAEGKINYSGRSLLPVRVDLGEWETWVKTNPEETSFGLESYLANQLYAHVTPLKDMWHKWFVNGEVLLLLDGLHTIQNIDSFIRNYQSVTTAIPSCPIIMSCRTSSYEDYAQYCEDYIQVHLNLMTDTQIMDFIQAYFDIKDSIQVQVFWDHIQRLSNLRHFIINPRLLSILCLAARKNSHNKLEEISLNHQTAIMESVVDNLFHMSSLSRTNNRIVDRLEEKKCKRLILENLAFDLQVSGILAGAPMPFDLISKSIRLSLKDEKVCLPGTLVNVPGNILTDFEYNSGLLLRIMDEKTPYRFLHRSIQQYLAASYLAHRSEINGGSNWDDPLSLIIEKHTSPRVLVNLFSWQPSQQEILIMLAGQLKDPCPLVEILSDPLNDDLFMHRRALAVLCILEVWPNRKGRLISLRDQLAMELLEIWFNSTQIIEEEYFQKAVVALFQMGAVFRNQSLDSFLVKQLQEMSDVNARLKALQTIKLLSSKSSVANLIEFIGKILNDSSVAQEIRNNAVDAVLALGSCAAKSSIIQPLCRLLILPNETLKGLRALAGMGKQAATPDAIGILVDLMRKKLSDKNNDVRLAILETIRRLGVAQHPDVFPFLMKILADFRNYGEFERCLTIAALAETDFSNIEEQDRELIIREINEFIFNFSDERVRNLGEMAASRAFQNISQSSLREQIKSWFKHVAPISRPFKDSFSDKNLLVNQFLGWLHSKSEDQIADSDIALNHIHSLSKKELCYLADSPEIIDELLIWLRSQDETFQDAALELFSYFAVTSRPVWVIDKLADIYSFGEVASRWRAAEVLGMYSPLSAKPEVLTAFAFRLKLPFEDQKVIRATARALLPMGAIAATHKGLMDSIATQLNNFDGKLSKDTLQELIQTLTALLSAAIQASVPIPQLNIPFEALFHRLQIPITNEWTEYLGALHRQGLRFFAGENGVVKIRAIKELCNIP